MYDLFTIGAGPGGYTAALLAAKKGLKVGIAEGKSLGGTCTNTGCIPTKTYIESVKLLDRINIAKRFAIEVGKPVLRLDSLNTRKARVVKRLVKGIEYLLKSANVDIFPQQAEFIGPGKIKVGESILDAQTIIVATGSKPKMPALFRIPGIWTSDTLFDVRDLPETLAIVGGGVIGMEMAHIFSKLGSMVTVIEAMDRILPLEDPDVSELITKSSRSVKIYTSSRITGISGKDPYTITMETPEGVADIVSEKILLCIGRDPVLPPGLKEAGVHLNDVHGIEVDDTMQTSIPGVYAVGDVTGRHMLAYVASREAEIAVDHITGGTCRISYRNIPSVIFTDPEIASVGKSIEETDLSTASHGIFPVSSLGRARTMEASDGFARITCTQTGKIQRITIVGPHATELITSATLAIEQELSAEDFINLYHPHPTMSELLKEAAEDVLGLCVHKG